MENILSNKTKETQNIPILFCMSNDYIEQLIVVITSILENNTASDFTFYIFHNEKFKEENKKLLKKIFCRINGIASDYSVCLC